VDLVGFDREGEQSPTDRIDDNDDRRYGAEATPFFRPQREPKKV